MELSARDRPARGINHAWGRRIFASQAAQDGGVVRRNVRDVEREVGRDALYRAVSARGFHLLECGGQFIIICNTGKLRVHN